jgi:hypothetical protein
MNLAPSLRGSMARAASLARRSVITLPGGAYYSAGRVHRTRADAEAAAARLPIQE